MTAQDKSRPSQEPGATSLRSFWGRKSRCPGFLCLLLALATAAVFWPVGRFDFVNYDDSDYVTANAHVQSGLKWANVRWAFTTGHASNWHPLTWLSHSLDCQLFGQSARAHHLVSAGFHLANTLLLFLVLRQMTGALWRSALVAALFALHPLHVESVAWVSERKDVLSGFFFLFTLWAYSAYVSSVGGRGAGEADSRMSLLITCSAWSWVDPTIVVSTALRAADSSPRDIEAIASSTCASGKSSAGSPNRK